MMQGSPVSFEFEDVSPVEKRLKVEVARELVNTKLDEGFKQLGRQVNLKGFRKGKAPKSLLENMFGKKVADDASRELVNESITFVIQKGSLRVVSEPVLDAMPVAKRDEPLKYTARIELMPQIEVKDYVGIPVTQRASKISESAVEAALERKRETQTELRPIEGREHAGKDDQLGILLTGTLAHLTYKDKEMTVDLTRPIAAPLPGLAEALIGIPLTAKDHEIKLTMPTDGLPPELAGKTGTFKITVRSAHQKHLPALDDDFAKDTGEAETLAELKAKIEKGLLEEDAEEAKHEMRLALVEELLKRNPVPLPTMLVQRLARNLIENQRSRVQLELRIMQEQRKSSPDAKFQPATPEQLGQAAHAEAVRNLSIEFVMMALADQEKVEVTDADLEKHLSELAKERDKSVARLKAELQREDPNLAQLRGQLRLEMALDALEAKAQVTQASQAEAPKSESP
jgi:trigger factor